MKTNKSYTKRLRTTRTGKVVARSAGQNHFNAKESGSDRMRRRRESGFHAALSNTAKSRFLSSK